jgi:hypothetical protein
VGLDLPMCGVVDSGRGGAKTTFFVVGFVAG